MTLVEPKVAEPVVHPDLIDDEVEDVRLTVTPPWKLIWWRFRKHRLAVGSTIVLALLYLIALFADFVAHAGSSVHLIDIEQRVPHLFVDGGV